MKYVDDFRDRELARGLAAAIAAEVEPGRRLALMEFCGGHTHAICRYGLQDLLPPEITLVHGPGCPVCVLPAGRLELALELARRPEVTLCTFGDLMRVPAGGRRSLMTAKAEGADVRMVLGAADALALARAQPERQVVFLAIGFETTTPPTAVTVLQAEATGLTNFSVLVNHVLTPAALQALLAGGGPALQIDGFIGPGHVATVTGTAPFEPVARDHGRPIVVAGFEPLDLLQAILMLVRQLRQGRAEVEIQFSRAVTPAGNRKAQALMAEVFEPRASFEWRGLGAIPWSALQLRDRFAAFDAERRWPLPQPTVSDHPGCACAQILRGQKQPADCRLFGSACTPDQPQGACMVSPEGSCAAHYTYGRGRAAPAEARRP